jgi:hypothetical protein
LPPGLSGGAAGSLSYHLDADGAPVTIGRQVLDHWLEAIADGSFARPLAVAITVPDENAPGTPGRRLLAGPFWLVQPAAVAMEADTARLRASFDHLDAKLVRGRCFSPLDRSPVRRAHTDRLHDNVAAVAVRYAIAAAESGDADRTRAAVDWAVRVSRAAGASRAAVARVRAAGE